MGLSDRVLGVVVAFGIATNIVACIMAVYIQKYELMINHLTNILFLKMGGFRIYVGCNRKRY